MRYVALVRFDDGSKAGPDDARDGHSATYEIGEVYKGSNPEPLLNEGLIGSEKGLKVEKEEPKDSDEKIESPEPEQREEPKGMSVGKGKKGK